MIRIGICTAATGADVDHTIYRFSMNPQTVDLQDSQDIARIDTLHGAPAWQESTFDSRPRVLTWLNVGATSTAQANIASQLSSIKSWLGTIKYINFGTLEGINNWPTANEWKKIRFVDVQAEVRQGGGEIRYNKVDVVIQPEQ